MRKKLILTALTLAMLLSVCFAMTITASAASYTSGYYKYTVSGGNATITDVSSDLDGDVTIPSTLDGYTVTAIGQDSFRGNNNLTSIVIPDTVIAINPYAFKYCTGITSVIFGSNLDRINYGAFHGCTGLRSVIIPNSVTSISYNAFRDCTRLTSVKIGTGLTAIPNECFQGCNNLTTVNIGTNVTSIGFRAFRDCSALKNITWGSALKTIGADAFWGCSALTTVKIPDTVTSIGDYAFLGCSGINNLTLGSQVTSIGNDAFINCTGLTHLIIPNSVTSISYNAFRDCTRLTSVKIGTGLTAIPNECFQGCNNLTTVNIGTNVTSIGFRAFRDCSALKNITWGSALKTIGADAFWGCSALTTVKIPDTVTSIGDYAFLGCSGINNLTLGKKLTSIGRCAFKSCTSLTHLIIPERVITIGTDAFINCSNITKVYIPLSLQTICLSAFKDSKKITDVYYEGTETDWSYISIQGNNAPITNAIADGRINYNYTLTDIADFTFVTYNRSATVIKTSGANIWTKAYSSGDSKLVRTAKFDSKVNVLGYATNETGSLWYKLSDGNWVYSTNVRLTDYNTADVENINKTFVVTSWGANVWSKPYSSGDSEVIRSEAKTAALKAVAQVRNSTGGLWYQLSGGGWIYSKNVNERIFDPADVIAYKRSATVIVPGVINIWGQPSTSAPSTLTRTAAYTTKLNVVAKYTTPAGGLWYQLTDGNWVYSANIRITDYNPADVQAINKTVTVTSWGANIWSKPYSSGDSSVVKTVAKAANLKVKGQVRNSTYGLWYQLADDSGWIYSNNVTVK